MSVEIWLLLGFFAFVTAAVTLAGYVLVYRPSQEGPQAEGEAPAALARNEPNLTTGQALLINAFRLIGEAMPGSRTESNPLRKLLTSAGYRWPSALPVFYGVKFAVALLMAVIGGWLAVTFDRTGAGALAPIVCGIGFGYLIPDHVLNRLARARGERLRRGLPAALDLMVLAVEGGQGMDQAIVETSRGLKNTNPELGIELTHLHLELRATNSRVDSIRAFGERTNEMEIRKFAALLIDTDRFGTSLGPALRGHAKYLRIRFRQKAQERARKMGVKLIFPVFFLIFPSVVLITLGPAVILIFKQLHTLLGA